MKTIEEKIGQLDKDTYNIKLELIELINHLVLNDWFYLADMNLTFNDILIRGISKRSEVLFIQNENAVEYSLMSLSISQLYDVYKYLSV